SLGVRPRRRARRRSRSIWVSFSRIATTCDIASISGTVNVTIVTHESEYRNLDLVAVNSFIPQRLDRVFARGADGGNDAKEEANADTDGQREADGAGGDLGTQGGVVGGEAAGGPRQRQPEAAADEREQHRFGEELDEDVTLPRSHGLPDSDLPRPLGHGDEH